MDFSVKYYAKKKQLQNSPTYSSNITSHSHLGGWHDGYVGGKRKTYKSSSKSGEPHFPAHEAGQKQKFFYNLYKSKKASAGTEAEAIKEYGSLKKARDAYEEKINALKYKKKLLEEKAGELKSFISDADSSANPDCKPVTMTIDLGENVDDRVREIYDQYAEYYSKSNNIIVKNYS